MPFDAMTQETRPDSEDATSESASDAPRFRMSYPVRDSASGETFTEQTPFAPGATATTPGDANTADLALPTFEEAGFGATDQPPAFPSDSSPTEPQVISEAEAEAAFETVGTTGSETEEVNTDARFASGGMEFRYSFNVQQGYNSNVISTTDNAIESLYTEIGGGVDLVLGGSRLDLVFGFDLGATYYYNNDNLQNDGIFPNGNLTLNIDYAVSERLDLSFDTTTLLLSQPSFTIVGASDSFLGNYIVSNTSLNASYRWLPKLETITGYSPVFWYYNEPLGDNFSRIIQTFDQQFLYLWKPSTSLVFEYRFSTTTYLELEDYDSIGNFLLLGFNHTLNPRSVLNFRGGAEQRFSQVPNTSETSTYLGPYAQLELSYSLRPQTIVAFNARYGTTAAQQQGYVQDQQFLSGLSLQHAFGRRLSGSLFFNYQNNFYDQPEGTVPDYTTEVYNTGLNLNFAINQVWSFNIGGSITGLFSSNENLRGNYTQNVLFIGTNLNF